MVTLNDGTPESDRRGMSRYCDHLEARIAELEAVLTWYGEQARLCRLIHSEGDAGRIALAADGGTRARAALENKK